MALAPEESYATLAEATAYHANSFMGSEWAGIEQVRQEQLLRGATMKMRAFKWKGTPTDASQPLAWPRTGAISPNGADIPDDETPADVKNACAEFALRLNTESYSEDLGIKDLDMRSDGVSVFGPGPERREVPAEVISMLENYVDYTEGEGSLTPRDPRWSY